MLHPLGEAELEEDVVGAVPVVHVQVENPDLLDALVEQRPGREQPLECVPAKTPST